MVSVIRSLNMLSAALLLRRLRRPEKLAKELRDYAGRAKEAVVYRAAAAAWAEGVPFAEQGTRQSCAWQARCLIIPLRATAGALQFFWLQV